MTLGNALTGERNYKLLLAFRFPADFQRGLGGSYGSAGT